MLQIRAELENHETVKKFLAEMPDRLRDVTVEASNKAVARIKRSGIKLLPSHWGISKDEIKDKWHTVKAKPDDVEPTAFATVKGGMVGLIKFAPSPSNVMGGKTAGGVTIKMGETSAQFKHAFVARMESGHMGVFERTGTFNIKTRRENIRELFGLSAPQMAEDVGKRRIPPELAEEAQQVFEDTFIAECEAWLAFKGAK